MRTYAREILSVYGKSESTLAFAEHIVVDFMERQKACGLSEAEVLLVYSRLEYHRVKEMAEHNPYHALSLFFKTMMGYIDLGTDIATMVYYVDVNPTIAWAQGMVLILSFVAQGVTSIALGQPMWVGLMGLLGMKPAVEAWRDATGAEPFEGQKVGTDFMIWLCRMIEMVVSRCVKLAL